MVHPLNQTHWIFKCYHIVTLCSDERIAAKMEAMAIENSLSKPDSLLQLCLMLKVRRDMLMSCDRESKVYMYSMDGRIWKISPCGRLPSGQLSAMRQLHSWRVGVTDCIAIIMLYQLRG